MMTKIKKMLASINEQSSVKYKKGTPRLLNRNRKLNANKKYSVLHKDDEYCDDEEFESETPEASNEHQDADIDINDMDLRMLNVNRMKNVNRTNTDKYNLNDAN